MRFSAECCAPAARHAIFLSSLLVQRASDVVKAMRSWRVTDDAGNPARFGTSIAPADPVKVAVARGHELRLALELAELEETWIVARLVRAGRALGAT